MVPSKQTAAVMQHLAVSLATKEKTDYFEVTSLSVMPDYMRD
jgi:hypothetical protein